MFFILHDLENPRLAIALRKSLALMYKETCLKMFMAALILIANQKKGKKKRNNMISDRMYK